MNRLAAETFEPAAKDTPVLAVELTPNRPVWSDGPTRDDEESVEADQTPERTDAALVAAANEGEGGAFEELYLRYRDWVSATAYRITRDRDDALDVLQDTFLYFFRTFPGFELRAKISTFLYRVVRNCSLERLRKRKRHRAVAALSREADTIRSPSDEARAALAEAVQQLENDERELIALRFTDEMKLSEIAQALEMPIGTVKSRLHHALNRLRRILKKH